MAHFLVYVELGYVAAGSTDNGEFSYWVKILKSTCFFFIIIKSNDFLRMGQSSTRAINSCYPNTALFLKIFYTLLKIFTTASIEDDSLA